MAIGVTELPQPTIEEKKAKPGNPIVAIIPKPIRNAWNRFLGPAPTREQAGLTDPNRSPLEGEPGSKGILETTAKAARTEYLKSTQ